jgi:hypothetical protein
MNERIRELAEQAGMVKILEEHASEYGAGTFENTPYPELEKFAELIVRECTHIIANQAWESRTAGANGDWTEYNTLSRVAGQIKEHFGVEE